MAWLAQELTKDENIIPYCSLFTASSPFSFPANFSVSQYLGLLFCNILKDNQDIQIFACWRSEHHFGLSKDRFKRDLGLTTNLFGTIADVQRPKVSLWKGITVQVLAIAGLIGTFSVFRDYFFVLFGSPDVAISYTENKKSEDVVEGGTISIPISALSEVRFFPMKVTFESVSLKPKNGGAEQNLRFDTPMFSNLPPGQSASIKIMGLAPQHSKSQQAPDSYEIRLVATAQGGYLRANRSVLAPPREVRVWPTRLAFSQLRLARFVGPVCILEGEIYPSHAYPQGAKIEIVYSGAPPEITAIHNNASATSNFVDAGSDSNRVLTEAFTSSALNGFEEYHYQVFLYTSQPVTAQQCQGWSSRIETTVE
jgi:hypothetical protein